MKRLGVACLIFNIAHHTLPLGSYDVKASYKSNLDSTTACSQGLSTSILLLLFQPSPHPSSSSLDPPYSSFFLSTHLFLKQPTNPFLSLLRYSFKFYTYTFLPLSARSQISLLFATCLGDLPSYRFFFFCQKIEM